jgi:hypothetical protein
MPDEKAPSLGAFLPSSLMHHLSGEPMHDLSGVDSPVVAQSGQSRHCNNLSAFGVRADMPYGVFYGCAPKWVL